MYKYLFFAFFSQKVCIIKKIVVPLHPLKKKHRGVEQLVARQAHNLEVARSNPASATTEPDNCRVLFVLRGFKQNWQKRKVFLCIALDFL